MTQDQYLSHLKKLGLTPSGKATKDMLGISMRQAQRFAADEVAVPKSIALVLHLMVKHKVKPGDLPDGP